MIEALSVLVPVVLGGLVIRSLIQAGSARREQRNQAWTQAARTLGVAADAFDASSHTHHLRLEIASSVCDTKLVSTLREYSSGFGNSREQYTVCDVRGLPGAKGVKLSVHHADIFSRVERPFATLTGDEAFDHDYVTMATPNAVAAVFLDSATRAAIRATNEPFTLDGSILALRSEGFAYEPGAIVGLARYGEMLARRWLRLVHAFDELVTTLAFDRMAPFSFEPRIVLAESFRHGHKWALETDVGKDHSDLVLHTDDAEPVVLRFPMHDFDAREVLRALEEKEAELSQLSAYR